MGDIALQWRDGSIDGGVRGDDLASDDGLQTAMILSLFTDARAADDDEVPGDPSDRRGWWGDQFLFETGDGMGSRLWLLERSKKQQDLIPRATQLAREALQWLLDDEVVARLDVVVQLVDQHFLYIITAHHPGRDPVTFRFSHVWTGEAAFQPFGIPVPIVEPPPGSIATIGVPFTHPRNEVRMFSRGHGTGRDMRGYLDRLGFYLLPR